MKSAVRVEPRDGNRDPAIRQVARALGDLEQRDNRDPLTRFRPLPPQLAFLVCTAREKLYRAGNQALGKSTAGLWEDILLALGRHPTIVHLRPPCEIWILCASWGQSVAIQQKLWKMLPKGEILPTTKFNSKTGFGMHSPVVEFLNGSLIRIKTTQQDALDLSGSTIDHAHFDEPPDSERIYAEVRQRVKMRGGTISLTLTPINRPVDWLKEEVERGNIQDLHYRLEPEHLIPVGARRPRRTKDGVPMDAKWIARERRLALAHEEAIVCDGEWEGRAVGQFFKAWGAHLVTADRPSAQGLKYRILLGIDHGAQAGNQVAILCAVDERESRKYPRVWAVDEQCVDRPTTSAQDAEGILSMLGERGLQWRELAAAWGDIPVNAYADGIAKKGNRDLEAEIAPRIGLRDPNRLAPRIRSAKRNRNNSKGGARAGEKWIHRQMVAGRLKVHPRCQRLIRSFERYDGDPASEHKHAIDGFRYSMTDYIWARRELSASSSVRVV